MAKKTASLESGNAATVGAGLRHVFGSVGEQEKIYLPSLSPRKRYVP